MNLASIMKPSVETISPDRPASEARERMSRLGIRHLPVLEGPNLVGLISERDLLREGRTVADVMTADPQVLEPLDPVERAMEIAIDRKLGAFPVVEHGRLVGIVTVIDLLEVGLEALRTARVG